MGQPLTPDALIYDCSQASDPQVSPDGNQVLYTLSRARRESKRGTSQVWRCGIDGSDPRQFTTSGERNSGARWSPDGAWVAYVADLSHGDRTESALRLLSADGAGEARELARHGESISALAWSPDGARLAYTVPLDPENPTGEPTPDEAAPRVRVTRRIDYKQDNRGYLDDKRTQVFVVDVASGERRQVTREPVDYNFPQWSPDGAMLAVQAPNRNGMCSQLGILDVASGNVTLVGSRDGVVGVWAWSPRGDRIFFAGDTAQTWQLDYFVYEVATDTVRRLTDDLPVLPQAGFPTLIPPSQPVWLDERQVLVHAVRGGASGLYAVDAETGASEPVVTWQALHVGLSADRAGRYVAQGRASLTEFGEIALYDTTRGETRLITSHSAEVLDQRPPARWERFDVARGGYTIEAWLLKPADFDPTRRYPVILDVHGGPNGYYGYGFNLNQQCLASNGFLVVFANPRGSGSYGREFTLQVAEDWGGEDFQDLMAVVDAVLARPYADPTRTGIYGYSYGGYMTSWTISQTDRFQAAVCGAPCFDLESFYGTSDIGHTFGVLQFGGPPHERRAWYEAHSPSTFAHRTVTPTLIVHGEADHRCPIGQGEQMFTLLKEAGCEVEFVRYPGASHLFMTAGPSQHRADVLARVLEWFKAHLAG